MQQYIVIAELGCIVRKIADDGCHVARFGPRWLSDAHYHCRRLRLGELAESALYWDQFSDSYSRIPITFKEPE